MTPTARPVNVDKLVKSGPTSYQATCQGTEGKTVRDAVGELEHPERRLRGCGLHHEERLHRRADKSAVKFTSHIAGVKVGNLAVGAIESSASAWKTKDGKVGLNSSSSVASIKVGNKVYQVATGENAALDIPGVAKLTFNQVVRQSRYIVRQRPGDRRLQPEHQGCRRPLGRRCDRLIQPSPSPR